MRLRCINRVLAGFESSREPRCEDEVCSAVEPLQMSLLALQAERSAQLLRRRTASRRPNGDPAMHPSNR